ncbi:MAG: hypothetical protein QXU16_01390 [Candidatus Micrarchaeaceae archaeon]
MIGILLQASSVGCTFGGLNQYSWININLIVVLLSMTIGALIYAIANLLPAQRREKLKGAVKYELFQSIISVFIIIAVLAFAATGCTVASSFTNNENPFTYSEYTVSNLLFKNGVGIMTGLFAKGINFYTSGLLIESMLTYLGTFIPEGKLPSLLTNKLAFLNALNISITTNPSAGDVFLSYSSLFTDLLPTFVLLSFASLLLLYLVLPIIQIGALTVLLPVALIMRSLSFTGPRLRESANSFLAIAIAFYFVLPLMIVFNTYVVNWMYCTGGLKLCNPYTQWTGPYSMPSTNIPLFSSVPETFNGFGMLLSIPSSFYASTGIPIAGVINAPAVLMQYSNEVAEYFFEGVFLIALDFVVTVAFAIGLAKGLSAGMDFIAGGSFWG